MKQQGLYTIPGTENGQRVETRVLEERIQQAVREGHYNLEVQALGQHGIGGRLWPAGDEPVNVRIVGPPGQRVGCMGFPNTTIEILGPASDDVGWLNGGAEIVVHGHATNGCCNAMAQGKVFVGGDAGSRAMTMTKHNPRFAPPELWVLGGVGDYFAEFMAGGVAVVCGFDAQNPDNVIGYRPCVGMVGGRIYFRGPHHGYSKSDAKLIPIEDGDWDWLNENLRVFLEKIQRPELFDALTVREEWQLLQARGPLDKYAAPRRSMSEFRTGVWDSELGKGGMIGDLTDLDRSPIPVIVTGEMRRFVPVWENNKYLPPCEASCPTGMPVHERWRLIREGRVDEAVDLALAYTPFPATVCGYLCPNLCMQGCTRTTQRMTPVDVPMLGKASIEARTPQLPPLSGHKVAVVGGGPAGISVAWQLRQKGIEAVVFDRQERIGGKIRSTIPGSRIPDEVAGAELRRVEDELSYVHLQQPLGPQDIQEMKEDYDFVVVAVGAQKPRMLPIPGKERMIPALEFLERSKRGEAQVGMRVAIIGAGNVGCDAAAEAHRLGAEDITLLDIQEPLSFGKEREEAERVGAKFRWPVFTKAVTEEGVELQSGEVVPADTVIVSIGDMPDLDFLPDSVATDRGFIQVNEHYQTTDPKIFAIGDAVKLGLLTDAIGHGRKAAQAMDEMIQGKRPVGDTRRMIDYSRIKLEYFDPRQMSFGDVVACGDACVSCGACRDCGICVEVCPTGAISRRPAEGEDYEMAVDPDKCIGCGFCTGSCPCGIWTLAENTPIG
jgi:NADPH-dependent glutamate synthase beta subunit-like oxidoreductase/glutamate synthase domain-containing protein 3/NAD-dependent dihydropyrimidine dehydrogenase PreA subunit